MNDRFPIGMRVLAVDDDRTCLKILEKLLQRCQYHVTTAQNAITALNLLRKNKSNFDLVISNVHMPDMDGFKLLELVGLEMDLPVIMFSANDDPKMVMKGVEHGACDYLLKPVRLKEVQFIWQHVIRKKKTSERSNHDAPNSDSGNGIGSAETGNSDQNEKRSRKRKDKNEDDVDEENEDDHDNDDPTAQKKPRVVWSADLHRKFVNAVNQLGIDKAVPKRILELMNVENLTREKVASHLQKYRLYLKRLSCGENKQAYCSDTSYLTSGVGGHLHTLNGSTQFHNNPFGSFLSGGGMSTRFNTPTNVDMHGLPSSGILQPSNYEFQSAIARGNPNDVQGGIFISSIQNMTNKLPNYKPEVTMSCKNNALILEAKPHDTIVDEGYKHLASEHSQYLPLLENRKCNGIWSNSMQLPGTSSYPPRECFNHASMPPTDNNVSFQGWDNNNNHDGSYHSSNVIGSSIGSSMIPVVNALEQEGNLDYNYRDSVEMKNDAFADSEEGPSFKPHQESWFSRRLRQ